MAWGKNAKGGDGSYARDDRRVPPTVKQTTVRKALDAATLRQGVAQVSQREARGRN